MLHNAIQLTRYSSHSMQARCLNSCLEFQVTCLTLKSCLGYGRVAGGQKGKNHLGNSYAVSGFCWMTRGWAEWPAASQTIWYCHTGRTWEAERPRRNGPLQPGLKANRQGCDGHYMTRSPLRICPTCSWLCFEPDSSHRMGSASACSQVLCKRSAYKLEWKMQPEYKYAEHLSVVKCVSTSPR